MGAIIPFIDPGLDTESSSEDSGMVLVAEHVPIDIDRKATRYRLDLSASFIVPVELNG